MTDPFQGVIYTLDVQGNLSWWKMNGAGWAPNSGAIIRTGLPPGNLFGGSNGVLYLVTDGKVLWFKDQSNQGKSDWAPNSGATIFYFGTVGEIYSSVIPGGDGVIYAIDGQSNLRWFRNWADDGTSTWNATNSGAVIWPGFLQTWSGTLIPGGDGVIYLLDGRGHLSWFRDCANNGSQQPDPNSGMQVMSGLPLTSEGPLVWAAANGVFYVLAGQKIQVNQLSISLDGLPSVTTTAGPSWTASGIISAASPLTPTNVGLGIVTLSRDPASSGVDYPTFLGAQAVCYADINAQVAGFYPSTPSFDLRAAYASPMAYPPIALSELIAGADPKKGEDSADWLAVQNQLKAETVQLAAILAYQSDAATNATALASTYQLSYETAVQNIKSSGNMTFNVLGILSYLAIPGDDESAFFSQLAGLVGTMLQASGQSAVTGPLSRLNMSNMIIGLLDSVSGLYAGLQPDWGKVQKANQILENAVATPSAPSYQQMGDAYEVGLYMTDVLSHMCILYCTNRDFGSCGATGRGLAYIPSTSTGPTGENTSICSRLTALGIAQQSVLGGAGRWSALRTWRCEYLSGVGGGWSCYQD